MTDTTRPSTSPPVIAPPALGAHVRALATALAATLALGLLGTPAMARHPGTAPAIQSDGLVTLAQARERRGERRRSGQRQRREGARSGRTRSETRSQRAAPRAERRADRRGRRFDRGPRGYGRWGRCRPRRALRKAWRLGVDAPRIHRIGRRAVVVAGYRGRSYVRVRFAHAPRCPVLAIRRF